MKRRTVFLSLLIAFILIFGTAFKLEYSRSKDIIRETIRSNKTMAVLLSNIIQEHQKAAIGIMQSYSRRLLLIQAVKRKDTRTATMHLQSLKENHAEIDSVYISDKEGTLWADFPFHQESRGKNFSYRDWYKGVSQGWKPYVSEVFRRIVEKKDLAVAVCVPVFDEKGQVLGILGTSQRIAFLAGIVNQIGLDPSIRVTLIDREGHVIYSNWMDYQEEVTDYPSSALSVKTVQGKRGTLKVKDPSDEGRIKYVAFSPVEGTGWSVIVERGRNEVLKAEVGHFIQSAVISVLLFMLIALSLVYFRRQLIYRKTEDLLRAEEALRKSAEEEKRLAHENVIVAEIGRIISSSLNIDEVYERFAEEVRKLFSFDRIAVNLISRDGKTLTIAYAAGFEIEGRKIGDCIPVGPMTREVLEKREALLVQADSSEGLAKRFPHLLHPRQARFKSFLKVPLFSKDQLFGVLHIRSTQPNAYSERDIRLAGRIGHQIAGAIANAQLFSERLAAEQKANFLEEQLRQSQKMEAVGRLAGGVAHDFNNLLTVIKGYSELSLFTLTEGNPLKGNIEEIRKASQRASDLTRQLLAFSRRQILEFKVLDLNMLLRNLDKMLHRIIGEDIELVYLLADHLGKIKSDPGQIEQMILNLALNARDAMPSGGKLTVQTDNVEFDKTYVRTHLGVKPGHYVTLSVSDTGCGLSPEAKEHLFEPFFTTKEKGKGTGLGLSTVYGVVKQSGGDIEADSELGRGTIFKIYLPRVEEEVSPLLYKDDKGVLPRGKETILLVEDEPYVKGFVTQVLRKTGYHLLEAANGNDGLRMAREYVGEIHLLLTDVVMPQMGGKELADRLKPLRPGIKVLFTSGYTDNAIVHHGVLEPGIDFLHKPFSPEALAQKVREVLDK
ncbi:MAG: cache domain-containing protein [Thermodesulfobacteriota bacterium]